MIDFTVPHSLKDCVRRLESTTQVSTSLMPYAKASLTKSTETSASFRFEMWILSVRLAFASGSLIREADEVTRVRGVAIANSLIQFAVVVVIGAAMLLTWQRVGGSQRDFLPFAIVFVIIGPGLSLFLRSQVTSALKRTLM